VAVSLYDCGVITLAMAPVLLFKGRTAKQPSWREGEGWQEGKAL